MKVSKWIDMGQEVEVEICAEDIGIALDEAFTPILQDPLGEEGASCGQVTYALNSMACFLRALKDAQIARLTVGQRKTVHQFLAATARRFEESSNA